MCRNNSTTQLTHKINFFLKKLLCSFLFVHFLWRKWELKNLGNPTKLLWALATSSYRQLLCLRISLPQESTSIAVIMNSTKRALLKHKWPRDSNPHVSHKLSISFFMYRNTKFAGVSASLGAPPLPQQSVSYDVTCVSYEMKVWRWSNFGKCCRLHEDSQSTLAF